MMTKTILQQLNTARLLMFHLRSNLFVQRKVSYETGYNKTKDINAYEYGLILTNKLGGKLIFKEISNTKRQADYEWNGRLWEHKRVSSLRSADNQTHSCLGQINDNPGGLLIQLVPKAYDISLLELENTIKRRLNRSAGGRGIEKMEVLVFRETRLVLAFMWQKK